MNGWQINYGLCVIGGRLDDQPDSDRVGLIPALAVGSQVMASRLIVLGVLITTALAASRAAPLLGKSRGADARDHPRRLGTERRGPAVQFRPAH
jgi:hypothetical protein